MGRSPSYGGVGPMSKDLNDMEKVEQILTTLQSIYDPELPVSIYDLGLIYEINLEENDEVNIVMTLTSPNCPVAQSLPVDVKNKIEEIEGINKAVVEIVFDPPWDPGKMSEAAKLEMNLL
jgi:FeS assembly SUF system protein